MNPIEEDQQYPVDVDAVISRHTGGRTKIGIFPPLGMMYVAAVLREHGIPVAIVDPIPKGYGFDEALRHARDFDVIIITLAASNAQGSYSFFSRLSGKVRIFMGTHATALVDMILDRQYADIVIRGEPEYSVLDTVQQLSRLERVVGISYQRDGRVFHNPDRATIENLDALPFPARDLVDNTRYHIVSFPDKPIALVLTSRGCPFACTYCATNLFYKRKRQVRSPENVVREVEDVVRTYGIDHIFFIDDTFTIGEQRVVHLCRLLQEKNPGIKWICLGRVDTVTAPMLEAMQRAGCREIIYGVESASPQVRAATGKDFTQEQIYSAVRMTKELGMRVSLFFMFGNPGDTLESIRETSRLARALNPHFASFNIATPDPGTPLYEEVKDRLPAESYATFDRLHTDFSLCEVPPALLHRELVRAYLLYYGRPAYWLRLLASLLRNPRSARTTLTVLYRQAMSVLS